MFNEIDVKEMLRKGWCEVVFTKANGEKRSMMCTLNGANIKEEHHPKGGRKEIEKSATTYGSPQIRVYEHTNDIDGYPIGQWRSFKLDSLTSIEPLYSR